VDAKFALIGVIVMKTKLFVCCILLLCSYQAALADWNDFYNPWAIYGYGGYYQPGYSPDYAPYFAMHPPVYYSHPIARTYGDSPFPYPPGLSAFQANSAAPQPQVIRNDHIDEANPPADQQYQTRLPLRIRNPFVEQSDSASMSNGAKWDSSKLRKPLVIYPASITRQTK
jgi:hypothetical protein